MAGRVVRLLKGDKGMVERLKGVVSEKEAWTKAVQYRIEKGGARMGGEVVGVMKRERVVVSVVVWNVLIKAWKKEGEGRFAEGLLRAMTKGAGLQPTVKTLQAFIEGEEFDSLEAIFQRFARDYNTPPDLPTLTKLLKTTTTARQVFKILDWRVALSLPTDTALWNSTIQAFGRANHLKGVIEIWDRLEANTDKLPKSDLTPAVCLQAVRESIAKGILTQDEIKHYVAFCERVARSCEATPTVAHHELLMLIYALTSSRAKANAYYYSITDAQGFIPSQQFSRFFTYARNPELIPEHLAAKRPLHLKTAGTVIKRDSAHGASNGQRTPVGGTRPRRREYAKGSLF
eukprot:TRINITY_DN38347_c0_g1_i1.p1 TRINITY_DN38347_c0_g1~~TRINITY_DN38347_c0_g1_i1.p1  ORF type:complete len:345 (+),score=109.42 TRINITY_DN38347_c0_g1_i1:203-1237(+)